MSSSFVAVDLGATSGRVVLGTFDGDGFRSDEVHRFANTPVVVDAVRCWDANALFEQTLVGLSRAVARAGEASSPLLGIAVDSWGVDYGLVDARLQLVAPMRHYRAADEASMTGALDIVSAEEAYRRSGIAPQAINTCFQLYRDARSGLLTAGVTALLTPDLWTAWLTGECGAERTIASTTGLVDWSTRSWDGELLERWGIPREVLPPLVDAGAPAGHTSPAITQRIGAHAPVPVYRTGAHDTASAFAAVTSPGDSRAVISCGTWALVGEVLHEPILTRECAAAGFSNEAAAEGAVLLVRNLSGTWLIDECVRAWADQDGLTHTDGLRQALLSAADDDALALDGPIDCADSSLVSTLDVPHELEALYARSYPGRTLDREHIVRLVLVSLADSFARTIRELAALTGAPPQEIVMIGGGARMATLIRLTEAATGLPVRVGHQESTSIGNICVQAVGAGVFSTLDDARAAVQLTKGASR